MPAASAIEIHSPLLLALAVAFSIAIAATGLRRHIRFSIPITLLFSLALLTLCLAFADISCTCSRPPRVAVMVDLSPSTRTAAYRAPAFLADRISHLLPGIPHDVYVFSSGPPLPLSNLKSQIQNLPDRRCDQTTLTPPIADAILLFSDLQFPLPNSAPPVYIFPDPALDHAPDAAVTALEIRGQSVTATVSNTGPPRQFTMGERKTRIENLRAPLSLNTNVPRDATQLSATLTPSDPWPENDSLTTHPPPPETQPRWYITNSNALLSRSWTTLSPSDLPSNAADYLTPSLIALDNLPSSAFTPTQLDRVHQFVRDLGGSLLILGGDHAFSAGQYPGTSLESLSALSSNPPTPQTHWIFLLDSSGSMSASAGPTTYWNLATAALKSALPALPPNDPISIASFARNLRWWTQSQSAEQILATPLPPPDIIPTGPTNLAPALEQIAALSPSPRRGEGRVRGERSNTEPIPPQTQLILLTDAQTPLQNPAALAASLSEGGIHFNLLSLAPLSEDHPIRQLITRTQGHLLTQPDPQQWANSLCQLLQFVSPDRLISGPLTVTFTNRLPNLPPQSTPLANRTWQKPNTTLLAASDEAQPIPLAAWWNVGQGKVLSAAFHPSSQTIDAFASLIAAAPKDPRFTISWRQAPPLHLTIDAADGAMVLNNLSLTLTLTSFDATPARSLLIPQTSPGRYELTLPPLAVATLATSRHEQAVLDRRSLAARYTPEFDHIGNNHAAMTELAARTGGAVIDPASSTPILFNYPTNPIPLTPIFAAAAALFLALALIGLRRR